VRAAEEFVVSCEGDDGVGCDWAGWVAERGEGTPADDVRAAKLYARGCDLATDNACWNLSRVFKQGRGVEKDVTHAQALELRACKGSVEEACRAVLARRTPEHKDEGERLVATLCDEKNAIACDALGRRLFWLSGDRTRGLALVERACGLSRVEACRSGAMMALHAPKGKKPDKAAVALALGLGEAACKAGAGCGDLAHTMLEPLAPKPDLARVLSLAASSCGAGDGAGCHVWGRLLDEGRGVTRDEAAAIEKLDRACELSSHDACTALAKALRRPGKLRDVERAKKLEARLSDED
jgi:TPR repeat protein